MQSILNQSIYHYHISPFLTTPNSGGYGDYDCDAEHL
jgi:hypothetical protein